MSSNNGCRKPWVPYTDCTFKEKMTGKTTGNYKEAKGGNPRHWALESSTSNAWGQPDQAKKLGLQRPIPPPTIQMKGNESTDDSDDEDLYSDDEEDLPSDDDDGFDLDGAKMSCAISRNHKMFRSFFNMLDKSNTDVIKDSARNYHCPACQGGPGAIDWYRGLQPLMLHAKTKGSKRVKLHRKFAKVLVEELEKRGISLLPPADLFGQWEGPKQDVKDVTIVWPPMVMIMNTLLEKDDKVDKWSGMGNEELLLTFGDYGALKAKHSYGPQGHRGMSVLLFDCSARGYIEAQRLDEHFLKQGRGRTAWDLKPVLFGPGGKRRLFGFMAVKEDLDLFNRHSHGKSMLKYQMRSYEEMVVKQIAQMSEDNELLIWYQKRAVNAEKLAKASEESFIVTCQKLRRTMEDTRNTTERSKIQLMENKEEMDYQAQFLEDQFKEMHEVTDCRKFQEETNMENVELVSSHSSSMKDFRQRVEEMIQSLELNMQDMQSFDAKKAKMEVHKEFDDALGTLLESYKSHFSKCSITSHA